jgi:1-aminocyclopropane-1-carboxylate deaminase
MDLSSFPFLTPSPTEKLLDFSSGSLWMKRDDLIHPDVSGNKWRKLKGFFREVDPSRPVLTFGGAHSNHLRAAAFAFAHAGIKGIAVVRGEELSPQHSPTLKYCEKMGMNLHFIPRFEYKVLREMDWVPTARQLQEWGGESAQILPEGGAGVHAMEGCGEIWRELDWMPDHLLVASGTGTTVTGILAAMPVGAKTKVHVISAVKGAKNEQATVEACAAQKSINLHWEDEVHFGGFGKIPAQLTPLQTAFNKEHGFAIDPVYNAKVWAYIQRTSFEGSVLWINTGGVFTP